jgi:hypothetical protein
VLRKDPVLIEGEREGEDDGGEVEVEEVVDRDNISVVGGSTSSFSELSVSHSQIIIPLTVRSPTADAMVPETGRPVWQSFEIC